jgi:hypothetical protein
VLESCFLKGMWMSFSACALSILCDACFIHQQHPAPIAILRTLRNTHIAIQRRLYSFPVPSVKLDEGPTAYARGLSHCSQNISHTTFQRIECPAIWRPSLPILFCVQTFSALPLRSTFLYLSVCHILLHSSVMRNVSTIVNINSTDFVRGYTKSNT